MKKLIFPFLFIFIISVPVSAQFASKYDDARDKYKFAKQTFDPGASSVDMESFTWGMQAGFLISKLRFPDQEFDKLSNGFQLGPWAHIKLTENLVAMSGLLFTWYGGKFEQSGLVDYKERITTLYIPLLIGYVITSQITAYAGLQPGFMLKARQKDDDGNSYNVTEDHKTFDLGLKFVGAYQFTQLVRFMVSAHFGLTNLNDYNSDEFKETSFMIGFSVAYGLNQMIN